MLVSKDTPAGTALTGVMKQMVIQTMGTHHWGRSNPIHWNPEFAREQGWPAPIAAGETSSAFIAETLVHNFGRYVWEGSRIQCKYIRPILAGDTITTGGVIQERRETDGKVQFTVEVWAQNQEGTRVTVGQAEVDIPA